MEPHIGMQLWQFDQNRRVYNKDASGRAVGGPIWREHWRPVFIVGETKLSWLIGDEWCKQYPERASKLPKRSFPGSYVTSADDLDRRAWVAENRHKLSRGVDACSDYGTLKSIEAALAAQPK